MPTHHHHDGTQLRETDLLEFFFSQNWSILALFCAFVIIIIGDVVFRLVTKSNYAVIRNNYAKLGFQDYETENNATQMVRLT